ncbi:L-seryl-tRNA(Sec) kinase [Onychostruthus taczanowskii]|uniref:L-seryl-tRNA(Sec) kinase n=1 Tax=Onychostruthus taczanowskii TaxID=356909 RepID=UPI001B8078B4|nr:L-seryl-tRNA(Sec) kinase [Onychostruthus taczanowskii]
MRTAPAEAAGPAALAAEQQQQHRGSGGGARVGLCLLCGLPAAGKSTLGRALSRRLPQRPGWACALLAYDELIPPEAFRPRAPGAGPQEPSPLLPGWKQSRRELLQCLEGFLRALLTGAALPAPAQPGWRRFLGWLRRERLLPAAEGDAGAASRPLVLLLDDNFYYQSMRYELYQLARKYSLGFCQLFLECPVECCLQRNRLRSDPVPEHTIQLMARKIEMPDPRKNTWEQHSLILSSSDCISEDDEQIMNLLATALANPERPNEEDTEQKEAARAICAASAVHQADQACRRIISEAMQDAKGKNLLPSEMKSLAEELNKLKGEFLDDLRQGNTLKTQYSDPATGVISSFQHEATSVINKYILK